MILTIGDIETIVRRARQRLSTRSAAAADALRRKMNGDAVSYVVTRNINYTNICGYHCRILRLLQGQGA